MAGKYWSRNKDEIESLKYKDVEKFKLAIWIAKSFSIFVMFIVGTFTLSYIYVSIVTMSFANPSAVGSAMAGFFEVIVAIVSSGG